MVLECCRNKTVLCVVCVHKISFVYTFPVVRLGMGDESVSFFIFRKIYAITLQLK